MEFFVIIPVTAAVVNFSLGLLVLLQNPKNKLNVVYFFWALALAVWNAGTACAFFARTYSEGLLAVRFLQTGVICLPFLLYHLCAIICNQETRRTRIALYCVLVLFLVSNFLGYFVTDVRLVEGLKAYYSVGGFPYLAFSIVFMFVTASAIITLHRSYRKSSPFLKRRIKTLLFSNYLIVCFGWNDILPILGVYTYPGTKMQILPLGSASAIFYGLMVGYSVVQDQLMDIRLSTGRATANILRALQVTLVGIALLILVSVAAPKNTFSTQSIFLFAAILVATGLVAAILFPRLFGTGADRLEKMISGDYFEYQDRVSEFIASLPWYTNFGELFDDLEVVLNKVVGISKFKILLLDPTNTSLIVLRCLPKIYDNAHRSVPAQSKLLSVFRNKRVEYLQISRTSLEEKAALRQEMEQVFEFPDAEICFSFRADGDPFGLLMLSPKLAEEPFSQSDLAMLTRLVRNLGLVVNQIRLQEQIQAEQELDLLGRISKGLAHDLNNLLTPVATLLQVSTASTSGDVEIDDLVRISERNVRIMKEYIRDSLFFSKTLKPQMTLAGVQDLTEASVFVVSQRAKEKGVTVETVQGGGFQFVLDLVLSQRLISNLLSNAIDASPSGSVVILKTALLSKQLNDDVWLQILVIDHGEGISSQNLEKMKAAFFTTKDSGDGKRGFGLGLAICRKIVHLHGGTLNISSQLGKGTTVQVDLPNGSMPVLIAAESSEALSFL